MLLIAAGAPAVFAQTSGFDTKNEITAAVLKKTLYAKNAAETAFCDDVIAMQDSGRLPKKILYGAYKNAVKKEKPKRFQYFQTTLSALCKSNKINLTTEQKAADYKAGTGTNWMQFIQK
ncbi:hypothetical protein FACS189419_01890 [Planctomycetales bacterium]|nr:hypothetical protein FACS189419_01890 [Planctomycetales bacterium]